MSIKYRDNKLGRYRKGVVPLHRAPEPHNKRVKAKRRKGGQGGRYQIQSRYNGLCAICRKRYWKDQDVIYDPNKPAGMKCVHISCYELQQIRREMNEDVQV